MGTEDAFRALAKRYPWPSIAGVPRWPFTLDGGGRERIEAIITEHRPAVMLEIGCFLCGSSRRWLETDQSLRLVGVDPWGEALIDQCRRYVGRPRLTAAYPDPADQKAFADSVAAYGPLACALANISDFRDRFVPVVGASPGILPALKRWDIMPDLIYIDADKKAADLMIAHRLWPNARITGDDWTWNRTKGYPMRKTVERFAARKGYRVETDGSTWILENIV